MSEKNEQGQEAQAKPCIHNHDKFYLTWRNTGKGYNYFFCSYCDYTEFDRETGEIAKALAESAQLREELSWYKTVREPDLEKMFNDATRDNDYQSLLIEKLSYALANVMLTIESLNMSVKNELHPDLKKAIADNVSIGREVLALLPQDEKKEGG